MECDDLGDDGDREGVFNVHKENEIIETLAIVDKSIDFNISILNIMDILTKNKKERKYKLTLVEFNYTIIKQILTTISCLMNKYNMYLFNGNYSIPLTIENDKIRIFINKIIQIIKNKKTGIDNELGIDYDFNFMLMFDKDFHSKHVYTRIFIITFYKKDFFIEKKSGSFFPYINTTNYDLTSLGIYKSIDDGIKDDSCIIVAFRTYGIDEKLLNNIKMCIVNRRIKRVDLEIISHIIKQPITCNYMFNNLKIECNLYKYGFQYLNINNVDDNNIIKLILFKEHYFLNYDMPGVSYGFKNYKLTSKYIMNKWWLCYKINENGEYYKRNEKTKRGAMKSKLIVKLMFSLDMFKPMTLNDKNIYKIHNIKNIDIIESLEYDSSSVRKCTETIIYKKNKKTGIKKLITLKKDLPYKKIYNEKDTIVLYCDFESDTMTYYNHKAVLFCFSYDTRELKNGKLDSLKWEKKTLLNKNIELLIYGKECTIRRFYIYKYGFKQFLMKLNDKYKYILNFHNLSYDKCFMVKKIFHKRNGYFGKSGNNVKQMLGMAYNKYGKIVNITIKCTYHLIRTKLDNFSSWFNLNIKKQPYPYNLCTIKNLYTIIYVSIDDAIDYIEKRYMKQNNIINKNNIKLKKHILLFVDSIFKLNIVKKDKFNIFIYTLYYCLMDCDVLRDGYEKFRKLVFSLTSNESNKKDDHKYDDNITSRICIRKANLNRINYIDLEHWLENDKHIYIGRYNINVNGANKSKWCNPYSVKQYGRYECLEMYKKYINDNIENINELKGKVLGCWCNNNENCHGDILVSLINCGHSNINYEKIKNNITINKKIDIYDILTIPQLGNALLYVEGGFEDVYEFGHHVLEFFKRMTRGGVCSTRYNKIWKIIGIPIEYLDVNSQYPNSMVINNGLLKGKPKIIDIIYLYNKISHIPFWIDNDNNLHDNYLVNDKSLQILYELEKYNYSALHIYINKINKKIPFACLCHKIDNINNYINIYKGDYYCDINELYDLIKYHNIEWKLIRGYYFNDGFNNVLAKLIQRIFALRNKLKLDNNGMEAVIKLIMVSIFGRMIMKSIDKKYTIISTLDEYEKYINKYYKFITKIVQISKNKWIIKEKKSIVNHFSQQHNGNRVLSRSKRDINYIKNMCEQLKILVFYGDTDSMALEADGVDKLCNYYYKKHNKKLLGNELGQYSSDYKLNKMIKKGGGQFTKITKNNLGFKPIYNPLSYISYYLAKKLYYNNIIINYPEIENGNNIKQSYDFIKCKGIGAKALISGIIYPNFGQAGKHIYNIFEFLYQGFYIQIDLTKTGIVKFKYDEKLNVRTLDSFIRTIHCVNKIERCFVHKINNKTVIEKDIIKISNNDIYNIILSGLNIIKNNMNIYI